MIILCEQTPSLANHNVMTIYNKHIIINVITIHLLPLTFVCLYFVTLLFGVSYGYSAENMAAHLP